MSHRTRKKLAAATAAAYATRRRLTERTRQAEAEATRQANKEASRAARGLYCEYCADSGACLICERTQ